jgi:hypothetical protein
MAAKASDVPAKTSAAPAPAATATAGGRFEREKQNEQEQHRGHAAARRHDRPCERSTRLQNL